LSPDHVASIAHTFTSTAPAARPSSRTTSSVTSVATPDARFGHAIHSAPAGSSAAISFGSRCCSRRRSEKNATTRSSGPRACVRGRPTPSGSSPSASSNSGGASRNAIRCHGLMPSLRGSEVPE
jgi:hypothetical protein